MLTTLVLIVHVVVCIALILIILLQTGKGADIGAAFGGGSSQTVFGSSGATTFLSKVTIAAAVIFMITSFVLTYFSGRTLVAPERSVVSEQATPQVPPDTAAPMPAPESGKSEAPAAAPQSEAPAAPPAQSPSSAPAGGEDSHSHK